MRFVGVSEQVMRVALNDLWQQLGAANQTEASIALKAQAEALDVAVESLEIIAGNRLCVDRLMKNEAVARLALAQIKELRG